MKIKEKATMRSGGTSSKETKSGIFITRPSQFREGEDHYDEEEKHKTGRLGRIPQWNYLKKGQ
jgi:hypothetical protein